MANTGASPAAGPDSSTASDISPATDVEDETQREPGHKRCQSVGDILVGVLAIAWIEKEIHLEYLQIHLKYLPIQLHQSLLLLGPANQRGGLHL